MYLVELYKIIEDGENSHVEFKRKFSDAPKIAKEMIALAEKLPPSIEKETKEFDEE